MAFKERPGKTAIKIHYMSKKKVSRLHCKLKHEF